VRLDDNEIRISGARRADVTGLGAREPRAEELASPISAESGNLGLNKAVIRWMSVEMFDRSHSRLPERRRVPGTIAAIAPPQQGVRESGRYV
jgi:hypothetical protein